MISAQVICDSISPQERRITTFKLRYPKFIHSEFMTHRVISRNASSSRAIPVSKLIEEVQSEDLRAGPVYWGAEQKGMQSGGELTGEALSEVKELWAVAAQSAAFTAQQMHARGLHKSLVNRVLEPFSHINVVATATEWENFFGLRLHKDAQPEMRALALVMWQARQASTPRLCKRGDWHLPFVWKEGGDEQVLDSLLPPGNQQGLTPHEQMLRMSVARCARVSYESFETGKPSTVEEDLKLFDRLVGAQPLHASPAEHQATPDQFKCMWEVVDGNDGSREGFEGWQHEKEWGNFVGWRQFRKMLPGEACAPLPSEFA